MFYLLFVSSHTIRTYTYVSIYINERRDSPLAGLFFQKQHNRKNFFTGLDKKIKFGR